MATLLDPKLLRAVLLLILDERVIIVKPSVQGNLQLLLAAMTVVFCGLQATSNSVQAHANVSFGVEFDDDVICAVDKLERDYVLKEVGLNSCDSETARGPSQDARCRRKENISGRRVGTTKRNTSRRKSCKSDVDGKSVKSKSVKDAMSLTVIKGHASENVVSSAHDEATDPDVVCSWNSPLLVSTPMIVGLKRRIADEDARKPDAACDAAVAAPVAVSQLTVTPTNQLIPGKKSKTKKAERTKLFEVILNNSLNAVSHTESDCLKSGHQSSGCSSMHGSPDGRETADKSATSKADSELWIVMIL